MNLKLKSTIESLLFITHRPLTKKELAKFAEQSIQEINQVLNELIEEYKDKDKGMQIIQNGQEFQMVTDPVNSKVVQKFLKEEITRELTSASLETLSIIAYRGPIARDELEQIRGVNCSIILRNLLIRGLISEQDANKQIYHVSLEFIRYLGINDLEDLPDYKRLNREIPLSSLMGEEETS